MRAWSGAAAGDGMGPSVTRGESARPESPPLKNGSELRAAGYLVSVGSRTARFRRKHKRKMLVIVLLALLFLLLCLAIVMTALYVQQRRRQPVRVCETRECLRSAANLALSMDTNADPCVDFNQFVCGKWSEEHPRVDGARSHDWFRDKQQRVYARVRDVLTRNDSAAPRPVLQARDLYHACMDTETLDRLGLEPAVQLLEELALPAVPTLLAAREEEGFEFDWLAAAALVKTQLGMDVLVGFDIFTDPKNSSVYRLVMGSPETTNPFPSMHNKKRRNTSKRSVASSLWARSRRREERAAAAHAEREFYGRLLKLFALDALRGNCSLNCSLDAEQLDADVLRAADLYYTLNNDLYELESGNETESAEEDVVSYVDIPEYSAEQLQAATGGADWARYLAAVLRAGDVTLQDSDAVLVSEPDLRYLAGLAALASRTPPLTLQLYVWMKVVEVMAPHTTSAARALCAQARLELRRAAGGDAAPDEEPPRSLHCANVANDMLGMAVAYAIVDPNFMNVTKPKIDLMIKEIKDALAGMVGRARWMDDDTKLASYRKIVEMRTQVGFPAWLLAVGALEAHYAGVRSSRGAHLRNMAGIVRLKVRRALKRFRQGNDFTSWATDPTEVNAYHTFQENTITVPMVMLEYPFFDLGLDSLNYGSLGTIVGHEITHGFDNFGRLFDRNGNFLPWWSNDTVAAFLNMTQCFVDQYSNYYLPQLGEHVDGRRTLGENIADNGGVRAALAALRRHLLRARTRELKLPGFEHYSSEQLFFLSYGNLWCGEWTREGEQLELSDEHSPAAVRARGALQNEPEFARAFRCPPGAPLRPADPQRCRIY